MKIFITRHSKTLWNQEKKLQGWKDSPLTKEGINDALLLKKRIQNISIDYCYSSPINRAKQTSEILFEHVILDDRLKEMNFGIYEGKNITELLNDKQYDALWNQPNDDVKLPGGESYKEVQKRLLNFIDEIYQKNSDKTIFITIHGMLFIILHGLMLEYKTSDLVKINQHVIRGCSLSEVEYDGKKFDIKYIGDDRHLKNTETISYK
ncbi:histidine phosphatase family protein [Thomasclavelia sp.]